MAKKAKDKNKTKDPSAITVEQKKGESDARHYQDSVDYGKNDSGVPMKSSNLTSSSFDCQPILIPPCSSPVDFDRTR